MIFSPARRVRDNTTKHTLENALQTREVVINVVTYAMVQQMSLASTEYDRGINEFEKAGFTMVPSEVVTPCRVGESPVQFECRVTKIEALGEEGGAGNLIFSKVVRIHLNRQVLDKEGRLDPVKLDLVARMGGNWYSRSSDGLFEVPKPLSSKGVGVDAIPESIRNSSILTGNDLGRLGNFEKIPTEGEVQAFVEETVEARTALSSGDPLKVQKQAKAYLEKGEVGAAWKLLLAGIRHRGKGQRG